jgi:23S rRNA (cytosine1962-C5)-methyltransferase
MKLGSFTGSNPMRDFAAVIEECLRRHGELVEPSSARRLFHGRGQCYEGYEDLTVDYFARSLLVGCFSDDADGARALTTQLAELLPGIEGTCLQVRQGRQTTGEVVTGTVPDEIAVTEDGLRFLVQPKRNQNVGLFLDMAPMRTWIRERAGDRNVLNLFAYTCAFSVAAVAGGARQVVNNDMSRPALDWGRLNHQANEHDLRRVRMLPHNVFKSWWKIRQFGPYDLVIIDPPTNQRGSFVAEKHYQGVLKRLGEFCAPGADVIACLNSPFLNADFLPQLMARWCPDCQLVGTLPVSPDFPDRFPDRGLKINHFRYAPR